MYKVLKEKGLYRNVIVENTDTKARVNIGNVSLDILKTLEDAGFKIGTVGKEEKDEFTATNKWDINVDIETASQLTKMAMRMKKPIRDQRKKEIKKKENKKIDAMDVLLGLASYN